MTDINELLQREKFEAWFEREYNHLKSSKYTDAVPHIKYGFWAAYQAGGADLVEAMEKAQKRIAELGSRAVTVKLPERYACELGYNSPHPAGDMLDRDDVIAALTTAGIKWESN